MATYATQQDFENYVEGWVTDDPEALERLLLRAERDIDRVVRRGFMLTNTVTGVSISGASGGTFTLSFLWRRVEYTTPPIPWNVTGAVLLTYLQGMTDQYGNLLPPGVWKQPDKQYYSQAWAYGPLPNVPVVFEAANSLGEAPIEAFTGNASTLTGINQVTVTEIVRGGLRVNPYYLSAQDSFALSQAVCAQAEYRLEMGEQFFKRAQWKSVAGPEFNTTGKLPLIGPKVKMELSGSDLLQRGARAWAGSVAGQQAVFSPIGTTPLPDDWRAVA